MDVVNILCRSFHNNFKEACLFKRDSNAHSTCSGPRRKQWRLRIRGGEYHKHREIQVPYHAHYDDVIMSTMASQITSLTIVYSTVYSGADQRKHQSSASLAFVRGIHQWPVNCPHKEPVTLKMFPFDDVIIQSYKCNLFEDFVCTSRASFN